MEIEKLLQIDTDQSDKIGMILSNNIDLMHKSDACISIKNWDKLTMEILAWHKLEVKNLALSGVIESAFIEVFDKADCIQHWHNTGKNDEGMVVSSEKVNELWEVLSKYRDYRHSL